MTPSPMSEPKLCTSQAEWVGLTGRNGVVFMNIISDSDQGKNGMYNTTSPTLLFDYKSTDNQHAAAFWSLLCTVVYKSQCKQTLLLSTPASPRPFAKARQISLWACYE